MKKQIVLKNDLYVHKISKMKSFELLEEISKFTSAESGVENMPLLQLIQGIILFDVVEKQAITPELKEASFFHKKVCEAMIDSKYN